MVERDGARMIGTVPRHHGIREPTWQEEHASMAGIPASNSSTNSSPWCRSENGNMEEGAKGSFDISHNFFLLFY
uniref:Uncharacterized protein n=1 Tax=Oryza glumipatula TaxID=40148 RepID=A0A0D9ZH66_9ORYZ